MTSGYRDDKEALRQRVRNLEDELRVARSQIDDLKQQQAQEETQETLGPKDWFVGVPQTLTMNREFPFAVSKDTLEGAAKRVLEANSEASVSQVDSALYYSLGNITLKVETEKRRTVLRGFADGRNSLRSRGAVLVTLGLIFALLFTLRNPMAVFPILALLFALHLRRSKLRDGLADEQLKTRELFELLAGAIEAERPRRVRVDNDFSAEAEEPAALADRPVRRTR